MNPKAATVVRQKTESKASPFELISEREQLEEARLNAALESLRQKEIETEKALLETEEIQKQQLREEARNELVIEKEAIGKELEEEKKRTEKNLEKIEATYKERSPKVIEEQVKTLLSLND